MRELIHRQHSHPVRRIIVETELAIDLTDRFGKWTAAGHDQQRPDQRGRANGIEHGLQVLGRRQQAAADFDDEIYGHYWSH